MLFLYFIQVFAYRTRAGVFLQRYFYFLVFSCVASDSLYNPVMGFFQSAGSFLGRMVREDSHLQVLRCSVQEFRVCLFWAKVPLFCGWRDCL